MTETMIERVARELCKIAGQEPDELVYPAMGFQRQVQAEPRSPSDRVPTWMRFRPAASQVIAAMREPSLSMLGAGLEAIEASPDDADDIYYVEVAWPAMIDAALAEGE